MEMAGSMDDELLRAWRGRDLEDGPRAPVVVCAGVSVTVSGAGNPPTVKKILSDVDFEVPEGEFCVLVGRSGCGKTTILNLLAGLMQPTQGQVHVLGGPPTENAGRVGYMFARDALLPWRTARRNVEYVLELAGLPKAERRARAEHYLAMVGLGADMEVYPGQLSQGMRQRVALARTWAFHPALLLMDEPFAALDAQTRKEVQTEFLKIWEDHRKTVVFVTHDLGEAIALADRVIVLGEGRILDDFRVPFKRPRDLVQLAGTSEFQELYGRLREQIG